MIFQPDLLAGSHEKKEAPVGKLRGAKMVHFEAGFPGVTLVENGETILGRLLWPKGNTDDYLATLKRTDELELYFGSGDPRNEYERKIVNIHLCDSGEEVEAWFYECLVDGLDDATPVPDGDWPAFIEANNISAAAEDWCQGL